MEDTAGDEAKSRPVEKFIKDGKEKRKKRSISPIPIGVPSIEVNKKVKDYIKYICIPILIDKKPVISYWISFTYSHISSLFVILYKCIYHIHLYIICYHIS